MHAHTHKHTDVKVFMMITCASRCLKQEVPTGAVRGGNDITAWLKVVVERRGVTGAECGGVRGRSHNTRAVPTHMTHLTQIRVELEPAAEVTQT